MIQFTIAATGRVVSAVVKRSTAKNCDLERCMVRAARRWVFPRPRGGGIVVVSYPFVPRTTRAAPGRQGKSQRLNPKVRVPAGDDPLNWL